MENILTIDFDIIMKDSIEMYNNDVNGLIDNYEELVNRMPLLRFAQPDLNLYGYLTEFLNIWYNNNVKIYFIDNHDKVLDYIDGMANIINIDHHHDLGYTQDQQQKDDIFCTNWAYQGLKQNKINKYIWINDFNSKEYQIENNDPYKDKIGVLEIEGLQVENMVKPDKIIICSSFSWIPTNVRSLFILWEKLFSIKEEK